MVSPNGKRLINRSLRKNRGLTTGFSRSSKNVISKPFIGFTTEEIARRTASTKYRGDCLQAIVKDIQKQLPKIGSSRAGEKESDTTQELKVTHINQVGSQHHHPGETRKEINLEEQVNRLKFSLRRVGTDIVEVDAKGNDVESNLYIKIEPLSSDEDELIQPPQRLSGTGEPNFNDIFRNTTTFTFICAEGTFTVYTKNNETGVREVSAVCTQHPEVLNWG